MVLPSWSSWSSWSSLTSWFSWSSGLRCSQHGHLRTTTCFSHRRWFPLCCADLELTNDASLTAACEQGIEAVRATMREETMSAAATLLAEAEQVSCIWPLAPRQQMMMIRTTTMMTILRQALSGFQMDDAARLAKAGLAQIETGASADEAAMRAQLQAALESAQSLRYAHEQAVARMAHGEAAAAAR